MLIEVRACDICRSVHAVERWKIEVSGNVRAVDLCSAHSRPITAVLTRIDNPKAPEPRVRRENRVKIHVQDVPDFDPVAYAAKSRNRGSSSS